MPVPMSFVSDSALLAQRKKYSINDNDLRLRQAAFAGDLEEVNKLLYHCKLTRDAALVGVNRQTQQRYSGATALHRAVEGQHTAIIMLLIKAGWSIYFKDAQGRSPLDVVQNLSIEQKMKDQYFLGANVPALKSIYEVLNLKDKISGLQSENRPLRILSLACGVAFEAMALKEFFPDKDIYFTGVDISEEACLESQRICATLPEAKFIDEDASCIDKLRPHLGHERFHLVVVRHPDILFQREIFTKIFRQVLPAFISEHGLLMFSTYRWNELEEVNTIITQNFDHVPENYCTVKDGVRCVVEGHEFNLDAYTLVVACNEALKKQIQLEESAPEVSFSSSKL